MNCKGSKFYLLTVAFIAAAVFLVGCAAPNWVHTPAAPEYYSTEPIPIVVGITLDEPPFTAQWWGKSKTRQDYGPEIVDYLRKMSVFKSVVYPYGVLTADVDMHLSVRGTWSYDNKGRAFANFMIGTANYNDFIGTHNLKVSLKAGDKEIDSFTLTVNTKGEYSAGDADVIVKELNDLQIKKIAVELANRLKTDRALIIDRINQSAPKQNIEPPAKDETQKLNTEKLDKLRESGVISEAEHKRAKEKITPTQADNTDTDKKLQELDELRKSGVLSEADYNKAKKRLTELQKLNELRQNGTLTDEEYNKAKARLMEK